MTQHVEIDSFTKSYRTATLSLPAMHEECDSLEVLSKLPAVWLYIVFAGAKGCNVSKDFSVAWREPVFEGVKKLQ